MRLCCMTTPRLCSLTMAGLGLLPDCSILVGSMQMRRSSPSPGNGLVQPPPNGLPTLGDEVTSAHFSLSTYSLPPTEIGRLRKWLSLKLILPPLSCSLRSHIILPLSRL